MIRLSKLYKIKNFIGNTNKDLPPLFINSLPKSGTNLIEECFIKGGYKRSWARCWNEKNINKRNMIFKQGQMHIAHLAQDKPVDFSIVNSVFFYRPLWDCLKSYVNYMYIHKNHIASNFIRDAVRRDDASNAVKALFFSDANPLGRSLVSEYERFYELDLTQYSAVLHYDDFINAGDNSKEALSLLLKVSLAQSEILIKAALNANTSTKNVGLHNIFSSIDIETQNEFMSKIIKKDLLTKSAN